MPRRTTWLILPAVALLLFLYLPIMAVAVYSFNAAPSGGHWMGFSAQWYASLFENEAVLAAAKNTLILAFMSTGISTLLGTFLGCGLSRFRFPGQRALQQSLGAPAFVPDVVIAASLLLLFALVRSKTGWLELGLTTMVVAHVCFQIPFVAVIVRAQMAGLNPELEEAARDLGANGWNIFRHITLPLMLPGVLAAALFAFSLSLNDFVISFFTSSPDSTTLPIYLYTSIKHSITPPPINTLSTLLLVASILGIVGVTLLRRQRQ